jgi:hypothetical protein
VTLADLALLWLALYLVGLAGVAIWTWRNMP